MFGMIDYVDWRGDLGFVSSPFNEVDNLILSQLVYIDFEDAFLRETDVISLKKATERILLLHPDGVKPMGFMKSELVNRLLLKCAESNRFGSVKLCHPQRRTSEQTQEQFSALCFLIDEDYLYVAFRGTDRTLVGWKEACNIAFLCPIPSQLRAVDYLDAIAEEYPNRKIITVGHSKGGNLAVYSAAFCKTDKSRIISVYSNDGPGFPAQIAFCDEIAYIRDRIKAFVPQGSIVGMLLEHSEDFCIVKSSQIGALQHDLFSWNVLGASLEHLAERNRQSVIIDKTLTEWISSMTLEERESFVTSLYDIVSRTDAVKLTDLTFETGKIIKNIYKTDAKTREILLRSLKSLSVSAYRSTKESALPKKTDKGENDDA